MAITDINISEQLETNAPSIKYTGNEGPRAPQQRASMEPGQEGTLEDIYFELIGKGFSPREAAEKAREIYNSMGDMSQAPQPNSGGMALARQMAAGGGIMGSNAGSMLVAPTSDGSRPGYGILKRLRKLIPNEIAGFAEKAAPFVAPFNPAIAGLMGGIGSFDRTGNLGGALKSGLMNYGGGQAARYLGGAGFQGNPFSADGGAFRGGLEGLKGGFSSPYEPGQDIFSKTKERFFPGKEDSISTRIKRPIEESKYYLEAKDPAIEAISRGSGDIDEVSSVVTERLKAIAPKTKSVTGVQKVIKELTDSTAKKIILGSMVGTGVYTAYTQGKAKIEDLAQVARGEGLDIEGIRAEVQEALAGGEAAWNELKKKYPYIGEYDTKLRVAEGGRIGLYAGGQSVPSDYTMEDAMMTTTQDKLGGITDVMKQADLHRQGSVGQFYAAQGGRIGYGYGGKAGLPPVTLEQNIKAPPPMPAPQASHSPMPAPQPNRMAGINSMMGGNPMGRGMNPMGRGMNPMGRGMNPMGRRMAQEGGLMNLGGMEKDYRQEGGFVPLGGKEKADDVPARLSRNEFVFTADAVRNAGGGDIDKGAEVMENVMKNLEDGGKISEESQGPGAQDMFETSERLSEVV